MYVVTLITMSFSLGNLSGVAIAFLANANNQSLQSTFDLNLLNKTMLSVGSRLYLNHINSSFIDLVPPFNSTGNIKIKKSDRSLKSFMPIRKFKKKRSKWNMFSSICLTKKKRSLQKLWRFKV